MKKFAYLLSSRRTAQDNPIRALPNSTMDPVSGAVAGAICGSAASVMLPLAIAIVFGCHPITSFTPRINVPEPALAAKAIVSEFEVNLMCTLPFPLLLIFPLRDATKSELITPIGAEKSKCNVNLLWLKRSGAVDPARLN